MNLMDWVLLGICLAVWVRIWFVLWDIGRKMK
jgi:hypothetical protein